MTNRNYLKGRRLEYDSMKRWREKGYVVARSSGSHGIWDICAVKPAKPVVLIQCKSTESKSVGARLIKDFIANPPLAVSECYHQVLEVKFKGAKDITTVSV